MPSLQGERVAQAIREHQLNNGISWFYRDLVERLHIWFDRFDQDFDLQLPTPIIAVDELPKNVLGQYRLGQNAIGARTTITFNALYLPPQRPFSSVLVTLIHEELHAWEEWHCGRDEGGWYHTAAWRKKMEEVGIIADNHGYTRSVRPSFFAYLEGYGLEEIHFPELQERKRKPSERRTMPKWVCGCPPKSGRVARSVRLHALCLECNEIYRQAE